MDLALVCDCLAPVAILQKLRRVGIPAERKRMRREIVELGGNPGSDPFAGCGADFVVLLEGRRLIGIRRLTQDDAVMGALHAGKPGFIGPYRQLEMLGAFPLRLLVLEGRLSRRFLISEPAIYALQYWCFRNHIFVFHTTTIEGTSKMLEVLYRKVQISIHELKHTKTPLGEP